MKDAESQEKEKKKEKKKKVEPLTVEDLLNIPLPKEEDKKPSKEPKGKFRLQKKCLFYSSYPIVAIKFSLFICWARKLMF